MAWQRSVKVKNNQHHGNNEKSVVMKENNRSGVMAKRNGGENVGGEIESEMAKYERNGGNEGKRNIEKA
jgi:hypothetical protein